MHLFKSVPISLKVGNINWGSFALGVAEFRNQAKPKKQKNVTQ